MECTFIQNTLNVLRTYSSWLCVGLSKCELQSRSFIARVRVLQSVDLSAVC